MGIDACGFGNARYCFARLHTPSPTVCFQTEILPYLPAFFFVFPDEKAFTQKNKKSIAIEKRTCYNHQAI